MTPLEELQAAHNRLSELRDDSRRHAAGRWSNEDDDEPMMRRQIMGSHGTVGAVYDESHADLIVTLHRTIDAQLAILSEAEMNEIAVGRLRPHNADAKVRFGLMLARAINGSNDA